MAGYLIRRSLAGLATLVVASFLLFLLVAVSGNPLATLMANPHISPATIAIARQQLGLNQPLLLRYWTWLTQMLTGNFGTSTTGQPVGPELWSRLGITLRMVIPTVIIAAFIAVIIGVVTAVRQYSILDHTLTGFAYLFYSAPVFVIAILLKDFLATDVNKA
ncbi:MAG: ABC transporter permease, partial [Trebonia sp.]